MKPKVKFAVNNNFNTIIPSQYSHIIGDKEYELKELMPVKGINVGNIRVNLSDARENSTTAKVTSATSYLPFGSEMHAIERSRMYLRVQETINLVLVGWRKMMTGKEKEIA